ncbi:hypothetical protein FRC14_002603 [Serendipita sp. 396]|nr:hypothetical protein FRC14_002603 [Serendipita sp. 396]KAG8784426.1 hypothetical protein FRC15_003273 [Serendipita sp. 397]KAG8871323.1 hypothetical protein FRC20_010677 [Serendipita sp. 405]
MVSVSDASPNGTDDMTKGQPLPYIPAPLDASRLEIERAGSLKLLPEPADMVFGETKTDHMLIVKYDPDSGWGAPRIQPYQNLELDPASHCLHYSSNLFEGMKAYLGPDGTPLLFRPGLNAARMARSAERLALPVPDPDALVILIKKLVSLERRWIPKAPGYSLYVRPTLIGTRPAMGVVASLHATLFIIVSPTGPFFKQSGASTGVKPISLYAAHDLVRSWPGGTGAYKLGSNYAPCFMPQVKAAKEGYQQVLWLLEDTDPQPGGKGNGVEDTPEKSSGPNMRITEAGQMNFFAVIRREDGDLNLVTPPLDGTVLPGVTRQSCLELAQFHNLPPSHPSHSCLPGVPTDIKVHPKEKKITVEEISQLNDAGRVLEVFGAGTAAVVCPIGRIGYKGTDIVLPAYPSGFGVVSKGLLDALQSIFVGDVENEWSVRCE